MSANVRKLMTEIQQVLKKVDEGVQIFDDMLERVYAAGTQKDKEKYEGDLKKEIKKLQRFREQIRAWIGNSDIKDKTQLSDARRLIETKMEAFRECEKDTKTKAYSKEGLARDAKVDPKEKEKNERKEWINEAMDKLGDLVNSLEADSEKISGGKTNKKQKEQLEKLGVRIKKNQWHIDRLELIIRRMENDELELEDVDAIKDDLEYYVDSAPDDDGSAGIEDEFDIYEELSLDGPADKVSSKEEETPATAGAASASASAPMPAPPTAAKSQGVGKSSTMTVDLGIPTIGKQGVGGGAAKAAASTTTTSIGKPAQASKPSPNLEAKPAPTQPPPASGATPFPPGPPTNSGSPWSGKAPELIPASDALPPTGPAGTNSWASISRGTGGTPGLGVGGSGGDSGRSSMGGLDAGAMDADNANDLLRAATHDPGAAGNIDFPPSQLGKGSPPLGAFSGANNFNSSKPSGVAGSGTGHGLGQDSSSMIGTGVANGNNYGNGLTQEQMVVAQMLRHSYLCTPETADTESRGYVAHNPVKTPPSLPQEPLTSAEYSEVFERLPTDALFFAFYHQQDTYQQYLAAKQLKQRAWRFHKKYSTWFQRHEEPKVTTDKYEEGTYIYFDYDNGWCTRIKTDFRFEFAFLEDELASAGSQTN